AGRRHKRRRLAVGFDTQSLRPIARRNRHEMIVDVPAEEIAARGKSPGLAGGDLAPLLPGSLGPRGVLIAGLRPFLDPVMAGAPGEERLDATEDTIDLAIVETDDIGAGTGELIDGSDGQRPVHGPEV